MVRLAAQWPAVLPEVGAADVRQGVMILTDAGTSFDSIGNPPELWLELLPLYAELQRETSATRWPELFVSRRPVRFLEERNGLSPTDPRSRHCAMRIASRGERASRVRSH